MRGLDRPLLQWMLVVGCAVLTGLLALSAASVRGKAREIEELSDAQRAARTDLDALATQLERERAAREAFSLELARLRAQQPAATEADEIPTLTLSPRAATGTPPDPTVASPAPTQMIELRLLLPAGVTVRPDQFQIAARDWSTGRPRWSTTAGTPGIVDGRPAVIAHITGEMLRPGPYELTVTGIRDPQAPEPIGVYELGVK